MFYYVVNSYITWKYFAKRGNSWCILLCVSWITIIKRKKILLMWMEIFAKRNFFANNKSNIRIFVFVLGKASGKKNAWPLSCNHLNLKHVLINFLRSINIWRCSNHPRLVDKKNTVFSRTLKYFFTILLFWYWFDQGLKDFAWTTFVK